ncbi:phosphoribosyltransferase [Caldimicrobium thiodismutans]|uniref:Phosphoribosyltransferase n=1 Tax=Caldimicrobium thiodismutans TaxID=1653476 RepID=A0A0U5APS5_9BACT|nr:ComF family protein [Caldimicrobium thiodismutans]BAU23938.1 phosphoribosyltransferase [Caldimicrobium thiodismutans]
MLEKILSQGLNFLFPSLCLECRSPLAPQESLFCESCLLRLPLAKSYCQRCGTLLSEELLNYYPKEKLNYCSKCLKNPPPYDNVYIAFLYQDPIKTLLHKAKFGENFVIAYQLGRLMQKIIDLPVKLYDFVLPVPLSFKRLQERGYNQSLLILWGYLGIKKPLNILQRIKHSRPQSDLSGKERIENVKGVFKAKEEFQNKRVLLLDDVMTTGATLREASKELKKAGAQKVDLLILARA